MADWSWPWDLGPSGISFWLEPNTTASVSPLSRATQVIVRQGPRWVCEMEFSRRDVARAARIEALLDALEGPGQEIELGDLRRPVPRGAAGTATTNTFSGGNTFSLGERFASYASAPVLSANVAAGEEYLPTSGWVTSTSGLLLAGDYIGVGGRLYRIVQDVASDGSGAANLRIRPRLRTAALSGAAVTFIRPTTRFRLVDNQQAKNRTEPGLFSSFAVTFSESLP